MSFFSVLHILHTCAILKSKRSLNESQVDGEEASDVIYEEDNFQNVTCRALCTTQWKNDFEVGLEMKTIEALEIRGMRVLGTDRESDLS